MTKIKFLQDHIQNLAEHGWTYENAFRQVTSDESDYVTRLVAVSELEIEKGRADYNEEYVEYLEEILNAN